MGLSSRGAVGLEGAEEVEENLLHNACVMFVQCSCVLVGCSVWCVKVLRSSKCECRGDGMRWSAGGGGVGV